MKTILYASVVEPLCTLKYVRSNLAFVTEMLSRYQSNPDLSHLKATKKALCYLQSTKDHMLTYRKIDKLKVLGYSYVNFAGCMDAKKSISGYIFTLAREPYHVRAVNIPLLQLQRCNQSLWHVMRLLGRMGGPFGLGILSRELEW